MKNFILFFILSCLFSCSVNHPQEANSKAENSIEEFQTNFSDTTLISNQSPLKIFGDQGTKIKMDSNTFVNSLGKIVETPVELVIEEVYSIEEMIKSPISTVSENGILETQGMIKITAFSEGQVLQIANGKTINLEMPRARGNVGTPQIFYGKETDTGVVEWELSEDIEVGIVSEEKINVGVSTWFPEHLDMNKEESINTRNSIEKSVKELVTFDSIEKEMLLNQNLTIYWILFEDGDFEVYAVEGPISKKRKNEITQKLDGMDFIPPVIREGSHAKVQGIFTIYFRQNFNFSGKETDYNAFAINQLGWVNCDFFIDFKGPMVDVKIPTDELSIVKMIFKNYNTIISPYSDSNGFVFSKIPENEPVSLIMITYEDETYKYSQTEGIVKSNFGKLNEFEVLSKEELEQRLASL